MAYRVLIGEDHEVTQILYKQILALLDIEATALADGEDILDALAENPPDLLILDVNLPTVSGIDILKQARGRLKLTSDKMKVILVTANMVVKGTDASQLADAFLEKPITAAQLKTLVGQMLNNA